MAERSKYRTVSLPMGITDEIERLIDELGYWPSVGAFVREAALEKIREERKLLRELRMASEEDQSKRGGEPRRGTSPGDQPPLNGPQRPDSSPKGKGGK